MVVLPGIELLAVRAPLDQRVRASCAVREGL